MRTLVMNLADLMADPGELDVSCLDCHHNTTMPVAALLPRYGVTPSSGQNYTLRQGSISHPRFP
jgi:hypothetical protein